MGVWQICPSAVLWIEQLSYGQNCRADWIVVPAYLRVRSVALQAFLLVRKGQLSWNPKTNRPMSYLHMSNDFIFPPQKKVNKSNVILGSLPLRTPQNVFGFVYLNYRNVVHFYRARTPSKTSDESNLTDNAMHTYVVCNLSAAIL